MESFEKMEAYRFCPKRQIPWGEPTNIVGNGREASSAGRMLPITSSILEELPACLWQS